MDLITVTDKIVEILQPIKIENNFKIIDHPFDPTDETVRTNNIINVEYNGESVDSTTNKKIGGVQRSICSISFTVNIWYKTSRTLNSKQIIPIVEKVIYLLSGKVLDEEEISQSFLSYEGTDKIERKDGYYKYIVKFSVKIVR